MEDVITIEIYDDEIDDLFINAMDKGDLNLMTNLIQRYPKVDLHGAFTYAMRSNRVEVAKFILDKDSSVFCESEENEFLIWTIQFDGLTEMFEELYSRRKNRFSDTQLLHMSAKYGRTEITEILLNNGADMYATLWSNFDSEDSLSAVDYSASVIRSKFLISLQFTDWT